MKILSKKAVAVIILLFTLGGCGDKNDSVTENIIKTIAVIGHGDFQADRIDVGKQSIGLPDILAARIMEHLSTSKRYTVVERTALRKVVMEQRFGDIRKSYTDRTLDKAINNLDDTNPLTLAVTGTMAANNDALKDFQDLGNAIGADYLVLGTIEKIELKQKTQKLPYSRTGFGITKNTTDARLRLRVIDGKTGGIIGASSFRAKFSEDVFTGAQSNSDGFTLFDDIGRIAASHILDLTFPAHIAGMNPVVLTRGSNDGTDIGDVYTILREGDDVKDSNGISIGRVRTAVGKVKVISTQPTLSVVEQVEGDVSKDDVAILVTENTGATSGPVRTGAKIGAAKTKGKATIGVGKLYVLKGFSNPQLTAPLLDKMSNDLVIQLGNTRRFDVLERSEIDQVLDEKSFDAIVHGGSISSRLNELVAADYIIHGQIENFRIKTSSETVPLVNEVITKKVGVATGSVRIVDVHTGKIIAADNIRIDSEMEDDNNSNLRPIEYLSDKFTTLMTAKVVERLYPIKVIGSAGDGLFYINRGVDGGLSVGDKFDLMAPGKELIDPDTNISFGTEDVKSGEMKISSIENSRSIVKLISGNTAKRGDILRRQVKIKTVKKVEEINAPSW